MGVASRLEKQKYSIREEESLCTDAKVELINKIFLMREEEISLFLSLAAEELNLQFDSMFQPEDHPEP